MNNEMPDEIYAGQSSAGSTFWTEHKLVGPYTIFAKNRTPTKYTRADKVAPVERIEGLEEAIRIQEIADYDEAVKAESEFIRKYKRTFESVIDEAARAYLKLQGGE